MISIHNQNGFNHLPAAALDYPKPSFAMSFEGYLQAWSLAAASEHTAGAS